MNRLLLIESSATLRHAAKSLAQSAGFEVIAVANYSTGLSTFIELKAQGEVNGVLLGWPVKTDDFADELFTALMEAENRELGVIVLSHIVETNERSWATKRSNTALVLWDEYEEFVEALKSLGCQSSSAKISEIQIKPQEENIKVLFVDDSPTIRVSYRRLLKENGYMVETASCVSEAMEKALENEYDIVITDYYMPDGTGDSLCAKLQKNPVTESITSAIITGTYSDKAIISSLAAGAIECMFKSEPKELFLARLHAMSRSIIAMRGIKKDHQHLQGILTTVGEGVYGVTCEGDITFINPAAKNILGYTDEEQFIGKSAHSIFHDVTSDGGLNPLEECNLRNAYKTGKQLQAWATNFHHANGKNISVECTVFPLYQDKKLEGSVVAFRDVTERRLLLEELKWQATHDQLTKLPNRSYFEQQLIQEVSRLKRSNENSALLYIDLDRFKYINDTAGHMVGDKLLIDVGNKFRSRLREADTLARLGGDEFAVIMRNVDEKDAYAAADNFRNVLEEYEFVHAGKMYKVHASIGIAYITSESRASGEVLANADIACYIAKSRGRNTTHFFHSDSDEISTMDIELGWSARLHDALKNDKFELYYQPILSLADIDFDNLPSEEGVLWDELVKNQNIENLHYEVLLRLPDSRGNRILPDIFLPTAERFNMMRDIDRWVIKHALANLAEHSVTGRSITLTINLSGQTLEDVGLSNYITSLVQLYKIDATKIVFEITETSAIANLDIADRFMNDLRELGCRFALDDFGSGFCSFSHLKYLSVDIIKIDGVFIQGMMNDAVDRAIVESIAQIARSVNKVTVAEFVENVSLLKALRDIGVDYIQGYFISPPKESSVFPELSFGFDPENEKKAVAALAAPQVAAALPVAQESETLDIEFGDLAEPVVLNVTSAPDDVRELEVKESSNEFEDDNKLTTLDEANSSDVSESPVLFESEEIVNDANINGDATDDFPGEVDLPELINSIAEESIETSTQIDSKPVVQTESLYSASVEISSEGVTKAETLIPNKDAETVPDIILAEQNEIIENDANFLAQWQNAEPSELEIAELQYDNNREDSVQNNILPHDVVSDSYQESLHESKQIPPLTDVENTENVDEKSVQNSNLVGDKGNFPQTDNDLELSQSIDLELGSDDFDIDLTESDFDSVSNKNDELDPPAGLPPTLEMTDFVGNADLDNFTLDVEEEGDVFQKDNNDITSFSSDLDSDLGKASR